MPPRTLTIIGPTQLSLALSASRALNGHSVPTKKEPPKTLPQARPALTSATSRRREPQPVSKAEKKELLTQFDNEHSIKSTTRHAGKQPRQESDANAEPVLPMEEDEEAITYPLISELYRSCNMKQEIDRIWTTEATSEYVLFTVVKEGFAQPMDDESIRMLCKGCRAMVDSVRRSKTVDFRPLQLPRLGYADQISIDDHRVAMLEACAIHYNLNFGLVIRYLGGEYTAHHRNLAELELEVAPHISAEDMDHIRRIFKKGCPNELNCEMPHKDKMRMIERGNQPSVEDNMDIVRETMNKEERNSHVVPFPEWMCRFSPVANHVSQGMVIKEGKDPRLVWDGTTKQELDDKVMNDSVPLDGEPAITFGRTLKDFAAWC